VKGTDSDATFFAFAKVKRVPKLGTLLYCKTVNLKLELLEKITGRAGDVDAAWRAALPIFYPLYDAGGFGALGTIRALVRVHNFLAVAGLGNLRHNACSP
jgi:hypothetical protein